MKKHKEQWNKQFENYKRIFKELGKKPVRKSPYSDHKHAAIWLMNQKKSFKENRLDNDQVKKIESLGLDLGDRKKSWDERYLELKKIIKELKALPSVNSENDRHRSAAVWMRTQFHKIRLNDLNPTELKKIESLPFFNYKPIKISKNSKPSKKLSWDESFENFKKIYEELGGTPSQNSENKIHRRYALWLTTQKSKFKRNKLSKDQISKLIKLEIELDNYKKRNWLESFEKLKEIYGNLGSLPSRNSIDPEHRRSSRWLTNQKVHLKKGRLDVNQGKAINGFLQKAYLCSEKKD